MKLTAINMKATLQNLNQVKFQAAKAKINVYFLEKRPISWNSFILENDMFK